MIGESVSTNTRKGDNWWELQEDAHFIFLQCWFLFRITKLLIFIEIDLKLSYLQNHTKFWSARSGALRPPNTAPHCRFLVTRLIVNERCYVSKFYNLAMRSYWAGQIPTAIYYDEVVPLSFKYNLLQLPIHYTHPEIPSGVSPSSATPLIVNRRREALNSGWLTQFWFQRFLRNLRCLVWAWSGAMFLCICWNCTFSLLPARKHQVP